MKTHVKGSCMQKYRVGETVLLSGGRKAKVILKNGKKVFRFTK